jgi:hypothetical protein
VASNGALGSVVATKDELYAHSAKGRDLIVTARSPADGALLWTRVIKDAQFGFVLGPTDDGVMVPFTDARGDRLALLDRADGSTRWDVAQPTYDVFGQLVPGIGEIDVTEDHPAMVDLRTGKSVADDKTWVPLANELARIDGTRLLIGVSPFSAAPARTQLSLPFRPDAVLDGGGGLVVVTSGSTVVGLVGGVERWRVNAPLSALHGVEVDVAGPNHLIAMAPSDQPPYDISVVVLHFDTAGASVLGTLPKGVDVDDAEVVNGQTLLFTTYDATPGGPADELVQLGVIVLGSHGFRLAGSIKHSAWPYRYVMGSRLVVPANDGRLEVWSLPDLHSQGAVAVPLCDDCNDVQTGAGLVVPDRNRNTITLVA